MEIYAGPMTMRTLCSCVSGRFSDGLFLGTFVVSYLYAAAILCRFTVGETRCLLINYHREDEINPSHDILLIHIH